MSYIHAKSVLSSHTIDLVQFVVNQWSWLKLRAQSYVLCRMSPVRSVGILVAVVLA